MHLRSLNTSRWRSSNYKSDMRQCVAWILITPVELMWSLSFLLVFISNLLRLFHQSLTAIQIVYCEWELLRFCNEQFTLQLIWINQLYVVKSASNSERRAPSFTHIWYSAWIFWMKGFRLCFPQCVCESMRLTYWTSITWDCTNVDKRDALVNFSYFPLCFYPQVSVGKSWRQVLLIIIDLIQIWQELLGCVFYGEPIRPLHT